MRAYATNEKGTTFSESFSFTTNEEPNGINIDVNGGYDAENDWDKINKRKKN